MRSFTRLLCLTLFIAVPVLPGRAADPQVSKGLQPYIEKGSLAGAVVLAANADKVLAVEAVGYADLAAKTPMRPDSLFWIASMSKPITAAALMILVDEKKVNLDDPAEKYLPELKNLKVKKGDELVAPKRPPTVRDLLSHTSGMRFASDLEKPTLDVHTLRDGVASYGKTPLQSEPGEAYSYSNAGINSAGRIIEVVSGMPYEEFLEKRLFIPLGMKDTTFWPTEEQLKRLAKSYKPNKDKTGLEETPIGQLKYPLTDKSRQPMPAGGLFSTAADVAAFCQMILRGGKTADGKQLLSPAAVRELTSTQTTGIPNFGGKGQSNYGLGFSTSRKNGGETGPSPAGPCGHGGAHATNMWIDPDRKLITVYMVQCTGGYPNKDDGGKIKEAFEKAARETFGK